MDKDAQLLQEIYKNAMTGYASTNALLPKSQSGKLSGELRTCADQYQTFAQDAARRLEQMKVTPKDQNPLSKFSMHMGIAANTLFDSSPSHMAELMINGSTMGIISLEKSLKNHGTCTAQTRQLGENLLEFEQQSIDRLKGYLG